MKNISRFFIFILFLFAFVRCEKPGNSGEDAKVPSLTVNANPSTIESGSSTMISITANNTDSVTSDLPGATNIAGAVNKSVTTPVLTATTTYLFKAYGKNGKVVAKNVTITVTQKPEKPTLVLTANPDTLPVGGGIVMITWTYTNTDKIIFNGVSLMLNGYMCTDILTKDSTFTFTARGPGGETTESITVVVAQQIPPTQNEAYFCAGPWKWVKLEFQDATGLPWHEAEISECDKDDLLTNYFPSKTWVYDDGINDCGSTGSGTWFFVSDSLINGGDPNHLREIKTLNQDTLVWTYNTGGNVRETYVHP